MTSSVSTTMSTRSTPRKRPQIDSFVTPMKLTSTAALTPAAALAEIDTPPLVACHTADDATSTRRRRLKRDVAVSRMPPHSPLLACEQTVDEAAAVLQRSLHSHLAAVSSAPASICNAIQLPTWRLIDDFVPHPTSRTTKALGSALRAPLAEPDARVLVDDDDADYATQHARYELRERIMRALWIVSLPVRAQTHRDPRGEYRQVLHSHPDDVAAIVAENKVRLPKRARNGLAVAVAAPPIATAPPPAPAQLPPVPASAPAKRLRAINPPVFFKATSTIRNRRRDRLRRRR